MRFFRLLAICVVSLALVGGILGTACAGPRGEQGPQGMPGAGIRWEGQWSSSTAYAADDAVGYQGSSYISTQDNNTNHLPTDTAWWDLWVAKGDTGATGAAGAQGAKGDTGAQGTQGTQGIQGIQGPVGPNMIVAAGLISFQGFIAQNYNITSCTWDDVNSRYDLVLTGIDYVSANYVTLLTTSSETYTAHAFASSGRLVVRVRDNSGNLTQGAFSFVVLDCP